MLHMPLFLPLLVFVKIKGIHTNKKAVITKAMLLQGTHKYSGKSGISFSFFIKISLSKILSNNYFIKTSLSKNISNTIFIPQNSCFLCY
jgi:hypothetical protein